MREEINAIIKRENRAVHSKMRHVRERMAEGFYTKTDIELLFELQAGNCAYCNAPLTNSKGKKCFDIEHIIPLSNSGTEWPDNIFLACPKCNNRKLDHDVSFIWKLLQKEKGKEFVSRQKKFLKTLNEPRKKISDRRKQEYLDSYNAAPFLSWIDQTLEKNAENYNLEEMLDSDYPVTQGVDVLPKVLNVIKLLSILACDKAWQTKNKRKTQNKNTALSLSLLKILILNSIHGEMELHYSKLKDFKHRFKFHDLFFELIDSPHQKTWGCWSENTLYGDICYDEYKNLKKTHLLRKCQNATIKFLKKNSENELEILADIFLEINKKYSKFEWPEE